MPNDFSGSHQPTGASGPSACPALQRAAVAIELALRDLQLTNIALAVNPSRDHAEQFSHARARLVLSLAAHDAVLKRAEW